MELKVLIDDFLRANGGYPLQSDEPVIKVKINDDKVIAFEESLERGFFYLFSVIDTLPHQKEIEILQEALSANLFHKETGQASIGFDKETRALVLFQKISFDHMDALKLQEIVTLFLAHLSYLSLKFEL